MKQAMLWAVGLVVGCAAQAPEDEEPAAIEPATVVAAIAEAQCLKIFECCASEELDDVFGGLEVSSQTQCQEALTARADAFLIPSLEDALQLGRIAIEGSTLGDCQAAIEEEACASFEPRAGIDALGHPGCAGLIDPQLTLSSFCAEDFECQTGFCARAPGEAEGACKNPPSVGEPCLSERCGSDAYCDDAQLCVEKLGDAAECDRNDQCGSNLCEMTADQAFRCSEAPKICTG